MRLRNNIMRLLTRNVTNINNNDLLNLRHINNNGNNLRVNMINRSLLLRHNVTNLNYYPVLFNSLVTVTTMNRRIKRNIARTMRKINPIIQMNVMTTLNVLVPSTLNKLLIKANSHISQSLMSVYNINNRRQVMESRNIMRIIIGDNPLNGNNIRVTSNTRLRRVHLRVTHLTSKLNLGRISKVLRQRLLNRLSIKMSQSSNAILISITSDGINLTMIILHGNINTMRMIRTNYRTIQYSITIMKNVRVSSVNDNIARGNANLLNRKGRINENRRVINIVRVSLTRDNSIKLRRSRTKKRLRNGMNITHRILRRPNLILINGRCTKTTNYANIIMSKNRRNGALTNHKDFTRRRHNSLNFLGTIVRVKICTRRNINTMRELNNESRSTLLINTDLLVKNILINTITIQTSARAIIIPTNNMTMTIINRNVNGAMTTLMRLTHNILPNKTSIRRLIMVINTRVLSPTGRNNTVLNRITTGVRYHTNRNKEGRNGHRHANSRDHDGFLLRERGDVSPSLISYQRFINEYVVRPFW